MYGSKTVRSLNAWCKSFVRRNLKVLKTVGHLSHLSYFAMVAFGGPYYWSAGVCLCLGVIGWTIHTEIIDLE